ncbi:MAG: haloacid dehalogenase [Deltaproteobacteria bacterium]|nr:haloacid dehalogenase [Deltaproteobacteria bacterium]
MSEPTFLTFDCYGTLIDWENGIVAAIASVAPPGVTVEPASVLAAYHEAEAVEEAAWRPYREVLGAVAARVVAKLGLPASSSGSLAGSLPAWKPFADTVDALVRLVGAGCRLGVLSNVDDALFDRTRAHWLARVPFDVVVTAEQVRSYKPGHAHFEEGRRRITRLYGEDVRWVHLAQSVRHDLVPCAALGIACVHVDRPGQALSAVLPAGRSIPRVPDLSTLATALEQGRWVWPSGSG